MIPAEIIGCAATVFLFLCIFLLVEKSLKDNGSDVRVIWYFYFLSICITLVLAKVSRSSGAIDKNGEFHGEIGRVLGLLLKSALGIDGSVKFAVAIVFILVAPQIFSYIFSGINGFGKKPLFVKEIFSGFVWWVAKTLVVAAGVVFVVAFYAYFDEWKNWSRDKAIANVFLSTFVLSLSFCLIGLYRTPLDGGEKIKIKYMLIRRFRIFSKNKIKILWKTHLWLTRRSQ